MNVRIYIPGEPKSVQSVRFTRQGFRYQPKEVREWKAYVSMMASTCLPQGFVPYQGGVTIIKAIFAFALPKSAKKGIRKMVAEGLWVPKTSRPDLMDNLFKGVMDALTGIVWIDDSQICHAGEVRKIYTLEPHIEIIAGEYLCEGEEILSAKGRGCR